MEQMLCPVLINDIKLRDDWNARRGIPEEDVRSLKFSMEAVGQLNVISVVRRPDGKFDLLAGEKRYLAAVQMKARQIDARIFDGITPEQELRIMLDENLVRVRLNVIEQAKAYSRLMEYRTIEEVAAIYQVPTTHIRERMDLLDLPLDLQRMMVRKNNPLRIAQAQLLRQVKNTSVQLQLGRKVAQAQANANEPLDVVREMIEAARGQAKLPIDPPPKGRARRATAVQEAEKEVAPADVRSVTTSAQPARSAIQEATEIMDAENEELVVAEKASTKRQARVESHMRDFVEVCALPFQWASDTNGDSGNWVIIDADGFTVVKATGTQLGGMVGNGVDDATARWVCAAMNHYAAAIAEGKV